MLTITRSLTNAQRSAAQAAPPSAGYNGLLAQAMIKKMKKKRKMRKKKRKRKMRKKKRKRKKRKKKRKLNLCGEKLLQTSLKANAATLTVPNAVKAGMKTMIRP